ncbi:HNH endonuclease [Dietzia sp. SYD-A1]|uniref:HNH endonuclease n=1 Tax=Dietzia sp. SYD-A1 TaxID=2780141 RepID=UPI0018916B5C|nr:HNH endonuclease [Dietzia sp. SYD-A1]
MKKWSDEIVDALRELGGRATRNEILEVIEKRRTGLTPHWKMTVQNTIERHSSDSKNYKGSDDLFKSAGIGSGVWALRETIATPADLEAPPETPRAVDLPDGNEQPDRAEATTYRVLRDTPLARKLKELHKDECQICGKAIKLGEGKTYSEAHHIRPLGGPHHGPDTPGNIVVLCPNHHVMLDFGTIPLSLKSLRSKPGHEVAQESIEYHNKKVLRQVV